MASVLWLHHEPQPTSPISIGSMTDLPRAPIPQRPVGASVRPASLDDACAMAAVEAQAAAHPWTERQLADTLRAGAMGWVAEIDGEVGGVLLATAAADEGELLTVSVLPRLRRRQVAASLLEKAVVGWRSTQVHSAWLEVRVDNEPAIALYRKHGWQERGRRRGYYADGTDALLMCLDLAGALPTVG